jgi:L-ascorbate metabolism protein UlaG (beta-lactamase superfamily)
VDIKSTLLMNVFAIGHSTFRLELDGQVILTDPWFTQSGILYHLFMRRIYPLAIAPQTIARCDAMLVTHNHPRHFGRQALELAGKLKSVIVGPSSIVNRARRAGLSDCFRLEAGKSIDLSGIRITAVPAVHPLSRDSIGFLLEGSKTVYFSGDTRFDWRIVGALREKRIDIAFLQASCSFSPLFNGADGMDINYAYELAKAIRPKCVIPMHYDCVGTYLDIFAKKRVSEHSLDVEDALDSLKQRLSADHMDCALLFPGNEAEF